jgi:outer membrane lipoprotein-sorting protein
MMGEYAKHLVHSQPTLTIRWNDYFDNRLEPDEMRASIENCRGVMQMKRSTAKRWLPVLITPALVAGLALSPMAANADVDLPDLSAAELMQFMATEPIAFSGTVVKVADMGLPEFLKMPELDEATLERMAEQMPEGMEDFMPRLAESNQLAELLEFAAGTHTLRVYYASPEQVRVQVLDRMSQRDLIRNGNQLWYYDDSKRKALTTTIDTDFERYPALEAELEAKAEQYLAEWMAQLSFDASSPAAVAQAVLAKVEESAEVTVGTDARVAGREAYELIVTPLAAESTIASVSIAIDGENGFPLAARIYAKGQEAAAFEIAFTSISFATPDASVFDFVPGPDVTVEQLELPEMPTLSKAELEAKYEEFRAQFPELDTNLDIEQLKAMLEAKTMSSVVENGWASVLIVETDMSTELLDSQYFEGMVLPVDGGRVLNSKLINVLITDDGRVLAGAVSVDYLLQLANG